MNEDDWADPEKGPEPVKKRRIASSDAFGLFTGSVTPEDLFDPRFLTKEERQRREAGIRPGTEPDWDWIIDVDPVSETITFGDYYEDGRTTTVRWDTFRSPQMRAMIEERMYLDALYEINRTKRLYREAKEKKTIDPVFGELVEHGTGTATYLSPESRERIEVTIDQAEAVAAALMRAGAINISDLLVRIGQAAEAASKEVGAFKKAIDRMATPPPKPPTVDEQWVAILDHIRKSPDPFKAAGEWLMKVTNGITEIVKEGEDE